MEKTNKLRVAAETILEQFEADQSQGYCTRDRQYVIDMLRMVLRDGEDGDGEETED